MYASPNIECNSSRCSQTFVLHEMHISIIAVLSVSLTKDITYNEAAYITDHKCCKMRVRCFDEKRIHICWNECIPSSA